MLKKGYYCMKKNLLEHIFDNAKEACMSDLKNPRNLKPYLSYIMQIEDHVYTTEDWQYVYMYLTGEHIDGTVDEIKQLLHEWVK